MYDITLEELHAMSEKEVLEYCWSHEDHRQWPKHCLDYAIGFIKYCMFNDRRPEVSNGY